MSESVVQQQRPFALPPSVVTSIDVSRLVSEVELLDNELTTRAARAKSGVATTSELTISEQLNDFLVLNQLQIGADTNQRMVLIKALRQLKATAPTVHITFASPADNDSLRKIVAWLRKSVNAQAVVHVGLQPSLIGGVYVRTPNHVHDLSLRAQLAGHRDIIIREVEAISGIK